MAWWCRAVRLQRPFDEATQSDTHPIVRSSEGVRTRQDALQPKWQYQATVDGWCAAAADVLAATMTGSRRTGTSSVTSGTLTMLLSQTNGDSRVPNPFRWLMTYCSWRLSFAWRPSCDERGVCFGVGTDQLWGEDFFLLDREPLAGIPEGR